MSNTKRIIIFQALLVIFESINVRNSDALNVFCRTRGVAQVTPRFLNNTSFWHPTMTTGTGEDVTRSDVIDFQEFVVRKGPGLFPTRPRSRELHDH